MVTHDSEEAMFMADRIAIMREGGIVQVGRPIDLYFAPVDAFIAGFFGDINRLEGVIQDGKVVTPFGPVSAPELPSGTRVEVLVRPEALRLQPLGRGIKPPTGAARVMAARMLGRSSLVHLSVADRNGHQWHVHARIPGRFLPAEDEDLEIHLDHSQAFVFPVANAT
jgi:iron(III) transport system ATP-binding protein